MRHRADERMPTIRNALQEHMNVASLKKLAALTGARVPTRKDELVDLVVRHLAGDRLRAVWQGLDELQRAAVSEVVHSGSTLFPAGRFRAKYGRDPEWGSIDPYDHRGKPTPLRFFFYGRSLMPDDLKERLKAFVPPPAADEVRPIDRLPAAVDRPFSRWNKKTGKHEEGTEPVPLAVRESELAAQRELLSVLRLVDAGKVGASDKTRRPTSAAIDAVTAVLEGGDFYARVPPKSKWHDENAGPIRAFAWPVLVQAGGLAQLSGSRLELTRQGRKALSEPPAETIRRLWAGWTGTTILDELSRIECVKGQSGKGRRGLTAVAARREAVDCALAHCPQRRWIPSGELYRFLRAADNDFAVTRNAWSLYICELRYGSLGYEGGERLLEERYVLCLLMEYAATLGLVDAAFIPPAGARDDYGDLWGTDDLPYFSRYDGLMFFRVTGMGAYCLGIAEECTSSPVAPKSVLRILPNLEIAAIGEDLDQGDRLALEAYAVRVSDLVWRLEPGKLLSAAEQGRPSPEVREFLEARSGEPLPGTALRLLEDVSGRCGRIRDRGLARLIECSDPALAALIANDARTRKHCMRAGERHLVVPSASESAFRRSLRDLGYLVASGEPAGARHRRRAGDGNDGSDEEPGPAAPQEAQEQE